MSDGGAKQEYYMSEMVTHVIADDPEADEVSEAKDLFELTVVTVSQFIHNCFFNYHAWFVSCVVDLNQDIPSKTIFLFVFSSQNFA